MKDATRIIDGIVDINFFTSGSDNSVTITKSTKNRITPLQAKQMFQYGLQHDNITIFDTKFINGEAIKGIPLNKTAKLVGPRSNTGWIGNSISDRNNFLIPQVIEAEYYSPRRLPRVLLRGHSEKCFAVDFRLEIFEGIGDNKTIVYDESVTGHNHFEYSWNFEQDKRFENATITGFKLTVTRWSRAGVVPRIVFFGGEMREGFGGDTLESFEILEEQTGSVDKLSYGLSANYCKASFVNRERMFFHADDNASFAKRMFYHPDNFAMLRPNRTVVPHVFCNGERYPLGKFYSYSWQLNDDSPFMSVKAYDILYSLQSVKINFGKLIGDGEKGLPVIPRKGWTVLQVIEEITELIETERRYNGLFDRLEIVPDIDEESEQLVLPYALIEHKSAWDVLQKIANMLCAYVYSNREGKIVIRQDRFHGAEEAAYDNNTELL